MKSALITGATAGIGASFAKLLAKESHNLVLVARDLERLEEKKREIESNHPEIAIEILQADLTQEDGIHRVIERINGGIDILINNAGFGINKSFTKSKIDDERQLLEVLVATPMRLTHAALPAMLERDFGIVINVSSVAGWIAGGTYSAAKSYLTVLSESLHTELLDTKVNVHALCPGFTRTEFHERGRMRMKGLPEFLWLSADDVTEYAWREALAGKAISIPGSQYKLISFITRYGPRPLIRKLGMNMRIRQRNN
jgi:short-subunit dehydrogenase